MKKLRYIFIAMAACFAFVFTLASCSGSKVSKQYADSINNAAANNNHITVEVAKKDLGNECNDWTLGGNGYMFAVKGYSNLENEEAFNKLIFGGDENTKYEAILIVCANEKCISAKFVEGSGAEVSAILAAAI